MYKFIEGIKTAVFTIIIIIATLIVFLWILANIDAGKLHLVRMPVTPDTTFTDFYTALFGGIIGGIVTLAGVALTIINSDKKHAEQLAIEYRPYLDAVLHTNKETEHLIENCLVHFEGCSKDEAPNTHEQTSNHIHRCTIPLVFKNKGRGFLSGWEMENMIPFDRTLSSEDLFMSPTYEFPLELEVNFNSNLLNETNANAYRFKIQLQYKDEFGNTYRQNLHMLATKSNKRVQVTFKDIGIQNRVR